MSLPRLALIVLVMGLLFAFLRRWRRAPARRPTTPARPVLGVPEAYPCAGIRDQTLSASLPGQQGDRHLPVLWAALPSTRNGDMP